MLVAGHEDAEPLILVSAIAGSAPLWYHQIPFFARHYRVYALDANGQPGRSDPTPPPFLEDGYTDWLLDVLDALDIQSANLAGNSSAGWYVMKLAMRAPERVKKIVMLSPSGLARVRFPIKIFVTNVLSKKKDAKTLEDDLSTRSFMPTGSAQEFDRQLARAMALATRHYRLDKALGLYDPVKERYKFRDNIRFIRTIFFSEPKKVLGKLNTPGLVILGEHELLYNANKVALKIEKTMPSLDVKIIHETGHSAMYDRPELFNETMLAFLKN
jgi:pimeloyl-ACP methyl ester carboxylesterase